MTRTPLYFQAIGVVGVDKQWVNWWDEINESVKWQDGIFFSLCALYALVSSVALVNTVFQLALVASALLQPGFGSEETQLYISYLSWLVASTTVASTPAYGVQHWKKGAALMNKS